jgi:ATP-dependent Clp protease ATP-binding subunit ClpA
LNKTEIERLKSLPRKLESKIIGQKDAINAVVNSIMRSSS